MKFCSEGKFITRVKSYLFLFILLKEFSNKMEISTVIKPQALERIKFTE
jgi:hypothetical protein